jgi:hypothetical protein
MINTEIILPGILTIYKWFVKIKRTKICKKAMVTIDCVSSRGRIAPSAVDPRFARMTGMNIPIPYTILRT